MGSWRLRRNFGVGPAAAPIGELRAESQEVSEVLTGCPASLEVWARRQLVWCAQQNLLRGQERPRLASSQNLQIGGAYVFSEGF